MPIVNFTGEYRLHGGLALESDERVKAILADYRCLLAISMPSDKVWTKTLKELAFCYIAGLQDCLEEMSAGIGEFRDGALGKIRDQDHSAMYALVMERASWTGADKHLSFSKTASREPIDKLLGEKRARRPISFKKACEICVGLEAFAKNVLKWPDPERVYRKVTIVPASFALEGFEIDEITPELLEAFSAASGQPQSQRTLLRKFESHAEADAYTSAREVWRTPEALARSRTVTLRTAALMRELLKTACPDKAQKHIIQIPSSRVPVPPKVDKYEEFDLSLYLRPTIDLSNFEEAPTPATQVEAESAASSD